ncbi:hypothetical protein AOLI_G00315210 [Acnodon oligacanthus]
MQGYKFRDKLVAQTYDGAAVMASALNGLQANVKAIAPSAMFVHRYAPKSSEGAFQAVYAKAAGLTSDPRDEPMRKHRHSRFQDPQEHFRNLYVAMLDNLMEQIPLRFSNLESLMTGEKCLQRRHSRVS